MPNKNYLAGRRYEYEVMKNLQKDGYSVIRAAGSHGEYDVVGFHPKYMPQFLQCKVVKTDAEAMRLIKKFKQVTTASDHYYQGILVKVARGKIHGYGL